MKLRNTALALAAAGLISGCATGPDRKPGDPFEPVNRVVFNFNDGVDRYVAVPVAKGYQKVTPQPLRTAVSNFFSNLGDLTNAANALLQLKITDATEDFMRFAFNSVFGLGGLLDWATPAGPAQAPPGFRSDARALGHSVGPVSCSAAVRAEHRARQHGPHRGCEVQSVELHGTGGAQSAVCAAVRERALRPARRHRSAAAGRARQILVRARRLHAATPRASARHERQRRAVAELRRSGRLRRGGAGRRRTGAPAHRPRCRTTRTRATPREAPNAASGAATGAPAGVPNYTDPGDTPASGAAGAVAGDAAGCGTGSRVRHTGADASNRTGRRQTAGFGTGRAIGIEEGNALDKYESAAGRPEWASREV